MQKPTISRETQDRLRRLWKPRVYAMAGLFLLASAVGLAWGSWQNLCATCPSIAQIQTWEPEQTSKLLSHDGQLLAELGRERRTPVPLNAVPPHLPQAVLAIEDKRFYDHGGFDVRGIARAFFGVLTGQNLGGGSTITQQLARNMFERQIGFERRYTRKLRELQVALELERSYSKDRILESYLNEVYLGRGWGVQSASRGYFGKNATEVNVAESALLAAILNRPGRYNPYTRPDNARARRNLVLSRMAEQGFLTEDEARTWKAWPLPDEDHASANAYGIAPYFEEWVRQILDSRFGEEVYSGGLEVYTTLDIDMQRAAREAMEWGWNRIESQPNYRHPKYEEFDTLETLDGDTETPYLQGAFVALDPHTGHVKALIGGRDFGQSKFDRARQAHRQAGSSFKPFVYASAIASGLPASHVVVDQPVVYPQVDGTEWRPKNFDEEFLGPLTLREALRQSINMIAIKLGWEEVGIETVRQTAKRMGIQTQLEPFPSTTIGASDVIQLQMVEAYSGFATLGTKVRSFPILRVLSAEGDTIWEPQPERTRVLDSLSARIMADMLQDAANRGTGSYHREIPGEEGETLGYASPVPTAGKTGTTNDATNTWFNGFTPNLVASVWFGMDRPAPLSRGRPLATGGYYAAPVWGRFLRHVYYGTTDEGGPAEVTPVDMTALAGPTDTSGLMGSPAAGEAGDGNGDTRVQEATDPAYVGPPGVHAGGVLPIPGPWPFPPGLTTREVDKRSGNLWSRWCDDPEENRYTEYYIPGTEPTEYCDDTRRIFRIPGVGRR